MARPKKEESSKITLNEYLATYSRNRNLDGTIVKWYQKKDARNTQRTKDEWDALIKQFNSEVV
jgi:hypothetical protein